MTFDLRLISWFISSSIPCLTQSHLMLCQITSFHVIISHACHVKSPHLMPSYLMPYHVTSSHAILSLAILSSSVKSSHLFPCHHLISCHNRGYACARGSLGGLDSVQRVAKENFIRFIRLNCSALKILQTHENWFFRRGKTGLVCEWFM